MKKGIFVLLLVCATVLSFAACNAADTAREEQNPDAAGSEASDAGRTPGDAVPREESPASDANGATDAENTQGDESMDFDAADTPTENPVSAAATAPADPGAPNAVSEPLETITSETTGAQTESPAPDASSESPSVEGEGKALAVYFSRVGVTPFDDSVDVVSSATLSLRDGELTGNMEILAGYVVDATGADLFQIVTEKEYPADYEETTDAARAEQNAGELPALSSHVDDMGQYDVIYLGYPNWWGGLPQAVVAFLEEYDFAGKTIAPFCSHEGSGLGSGLRDIAAICPDAAVLEGFSVRGGNVGNAREDVNDWLDGLGLL
jgi:flavodoxin